MAPRQGALKAERQFRELLEYLTLPVHPGHRLAALTRFLQLLESERMPVEAYLPELANRLTFHEPIGEYLGLDPADLHDQLQTVSRSLRSASSHPLVASIESGLRVFERALALSYACVGEFTKAARVLQPVDAAEAVWLGEIEKTLVGPPLARLHHLTVEAETRRSPVAGSLRELAADLGQALPEGSAFIPAVEKSPWPDDTEGQKGVLRSVTLDFPRKGKGPVGRLETTTPIVGDSRARAVPFESPSAAARAFAEEEGLPVKGVYLHAQVNLGRTGTFHQGSSSDLAVGAMAYCEIRRLMHLREECRVSSHVAVTGRLDADGAVREVDAKTLPEKVRAAFFSPLECLVVPRPQVEAAAETVRSLKSRHPHRDLPVLGAGHLRDLFFDRRIVSKTLTPLPLHVARGVWRRRRPIALGLILALSAVVAAILYGPIDKNPAGCEVNGQTLTLLNRKGQPVAGIPVSLRTAQSLQHSLRPSSSRRLVAFGDLDGDSRSEVFYVTRPPVDSNDPDSIVCASPDGRKIRWQRPMSFPVDFPESPDALSNAFRAGEIAYEVLERDGLARLVVLANHVFFPSVVAILDPVTGETVASYLHVGTLGDMAIADLDGDLTREILAAGTNNAFDFACFCVLDPSRLGGHSPTRGRYGVRGLKPGNEKAYFLIPRTIVGQAFAGRFARNGALSVEVESSKREVVLTVNDAGGAIGEGPGALEPLIYLRFGFDLSPRGLTLSNEYDLVARTLVGGARLKELPGKAYYQKFLEGVTRWDAPKETRTAEAGGP